MKGVKLEIFGTIETEQQEDVEILCQTDEGNSSIELTVPAYKETPAKRMIFTEQEFDHIIALVDDFKKKRGAVASTYTKES